MNDAPPDYAGHTPTGDQVAAQSRGHTEFETPPDAPPCAEDLDEVGAERVAAAHDELGDEVAQPGDHPYDPGADPDAPAPAGQVGDTETTGGGDPSEAGAELPSSVTSSAGTSGQLSGALSTDGDKPWIPFSER